jgi:glutathione S-transferase
MQCLAGSKLNSLWPEGARVRAGIARWHFWQVAHWHEGCAGFIWENVVKKLMGGDDPDAAALKQAG